MKTFTAIVRATVGPNTRNISTEIRASSSTDAKWLLQAIYGFHSVLSAPSEVQAEMAVLDEIIAPKTPDQQRVANLKAASDRARDALNAERTRQKRAKALKALSPMPSTSTSLHTTH